MKEIRNYVISIDEKLKSISSVLRYMWTLIRILIY